MFQATVDQSHKGTLSLGEGIPGNVYHSRRLSDRIDDQSCTIQSTYENSTDPIQTNERLYFSENIITYHLANSPIEGFHQMSEQSEPVEIEISFTGNFGPEDIEYIILPGIQLTVDNLIEYPDSSAGSTERLRIESVTFSLQSKVQPFSVNGEEYDGSYQDVWIDNPPPTYEQIINAGINNGLKPYSIPINKKYMSEDESGYVFFGGEESETVPVHLLNNTTSEEIILHATVAVKSKQFNPLSNINFSYSVWLNYNNQSNNGQHVFNQNIVDYPEGSDGKNIEELVAQGYIQRKFGGTDLLEIDIPIPYNTSSLNVVNGLANRRLRISVKKTDSPEDFPLANENFEDGEVEDYEVLFKSSLCSDGTPMPYDYIVYSEDIYPYCSYIADKIRLADGSGYELTSTDAVTYNVDKQSFIQYGLAKHPKTAYDGNVKALTASAREGAVGDIPENFIPYDIPEGYDYASSNPDDANLPRYDPKHPEYHKMYFSPLLSELNDAGSMANLPLYADVYYPIPKEQSISNLKKLPLIIWNAGGAFLTNTKSTSKIDAVGRWLASRGYIVAAMDYRQGIFLEKELIRRSFIQGWQDGQMAVKWWKQSGFAKAYLDGEGKPTKDEIANVNDPDDLTANTPLWNVDTDKIYFAGHSAGGINSFHTTLLTPLMLQDEVDSGIFSEGITGTYLDEKFDFENSANLLHFESIPCLDVSAGNLCDILSRSAKINPNTNKPYWRTPDCDTNDPNDPCPNFTTSELDEINTRLTDFEATSGRPTKTVAHAGALIKIEWLTDSPDRPPLAGVHHVDDGLVPSNYDFIFKGVNYLYAILQYIGGIDKLYGTAAMEEEIDKPENQYPSFNTLIMQGPEKGGGSEGGFTHHAVEYPFGGYSHEEYKNDPDLATSLGYLLEDKVMLFTDAFFTNPWQNAENSSGINFKKSPHQIKKHLADENREDLNHLAYPHSNRELTLNSSSDILVFPNPTKDELNILIDIEEAGPLYLELVDMQGRLVYEMKENRISKGYQRITLQNLNLPAGIYVLRISGSLVDERKLVVFE